MGVPIAFGSPGLGILMVAVGVFLGGVAIVLWTRTEKDARQSPGPSLSERGEALADEITAFKAGRDRGKPVWNPYWPRNDEEREFRDEQEDRYRAETETLFDTQLVGRIDTFVEDARAAGFELDETEMRRSGLERPGFLAGPDPMGDRARAIRKLAGKCKRGES